MKNLEESSLLKGQDESHHSELVENRPSEEKNIQNFRYCHKNFKKTFSFPFLQTVI